MKHFETEKTTKHQKIIAKKHKGYSMPFITKQKHKHYVLPTLRAPHRLTDGPISIHIQDRHDGFLGCFDCNSFKAFQQGTRWTKHCDLCSLVLRTKQTHGGFVVIHCFGMSSGETKIGMNQRICLDSSIIQSIQSCNSSALLKPVEGVVCLQFGSMEVW